MNENKMFVIVKGEDKTKDIEKIEYDWMNGKYYIKYFKGDKNYSYKMMDIKVEKYEKELNIKNKKVYYNNSRIFDVKKAVKYEKAIRIIYEDETNELYLDGENIRIKSGNENKKEKNQKQILNYYKQIAKYAKVKEENTEKSQNGTFLEKEYSKLHSVSKESVLEYFLNKKKLKKPQKEKIDLIYPFRFNLSQKEAVSNVYKSNISIIEGPPGTGKTQTILNIIANLAIMQNKTVAVVSNNNEAVKNVKEKLEKNGYGFILADLGRKEKRKEFFENQPQPRLRGFKIEEKERKNLSKKIKKLNVILDNLLERKNRQANLTKEIEDYKLEQKYFDEYYKNQDIKKIKTLDFYNKTDDRIIQFLIDTQMKKEDKIKSEKLYKWKIFFKYGLKDIKQFDEDFIENVLALQREFYKIKIEKLQKELENINNVLKRYKFSELQKSHQEISEKLFKNALYEKYKYIHNNYTYDNYQSKMKKFVESYPVILSTTYSLRNSIPNDYLLDYLIIDESSQVDLLTGVLAISKAKNVIIVGDTKQLPQIVNEEIKNKVKDNNVENCYNYFENNILSSMLEIYGKQLPRKILKEHYRCHPKIIEFCNKRYYNGELIAFANNEHNDVKTPLIIYYTAPGNHLRKLKGENKTDTFNMREVETIKEEVLQDKRVNNYSDKDIGITTPYRLQADIMQKFDGEIESDTIHKYQGREKKLMVFSTVLDNTKQGQMGINFVDEACMVNVAVSRAIDQFVIVTDNKLFNTKGKEIKALLKYIKYNEMDSEIVQSQIVSVFDLLYKEYSKKLEKLSKNLLNRRKYKSENIMDTILYNELKKDDYIDFEFTGECLLRDLINDLEGLSEDEKRYINNRASVDFVIFDKMDKKPILLIEVDGFVFHRNNEEQLKKDKMKNNIARKKNIPILRFETGEKAYDEQKIISEIRKVILKD